MSSCLLILNLIEDLVSARGRANNNWQQVVERQLIATTNQVTQYARIRKIPVVWVRIGFDDHYQDIPAYSPILSQLKQIGAFRINQVGCHWAEGLVMSADDQQFIAKGIAAFTGNHLLEFLQQNHRHHLLLGGLSSHMAIESTARIAHDLKFKVTILEDLCAGPTLESHLNSMDNLRAFAEISSTKEWMKI